VVQVDDGLKMRRDLPPVDYGANGVFPAVVSPLD
jgi:hypothetical protein